mgnify:FL=1
MKFQNKELPMLAEALLSLSLKGKRNRKRTQFFCMLQDYYQNVFQKQREALLQEYPEVDDEGIPTDVQFFEEASQLMEEYYYIELNQQNEDMILTVAEIFLDDELDLEVSGEVAIVFEKWCQEFEEAQKHYNKD